MENRKVGRPKSHFELQSIHLRVSVQKYNELKKLSEQTMIPMNSIVMLALEDYFEKVAKKETK